MWSPAASGVLQGSKNKLETAIKTFYLLKSLLLWAIQEAVPTHRFFFTGKCLSTRASIAQDSANRKVKADLIDEERET